MPALQMFSPEKFQMFSDYMKLKGFNAYYPKDFKIDKERLGLVSPRKKTGSQVKFYYTKNGLTLVVCSTFDPIANEALPKRNGWVLIKEGDDKKYFAHPFYRTEGFLRRVYYYAIINKCRIDNRPVCPRCKKFMDIVHGKGIKSRYWKCSNPNHEVETKDWDHGLKKWMKDYLETIRKARAKQKKKYEITQAEKGKVVIPAVLRRLPWEMQNPQNKI